MHGQCFASVVVANLVIQTLERRGNKHEAGQFLLCSVFQAATSLTVY